MQKLNSFFLYLQQPQVLKTEVDLTINTIILTQPVPELRRLCPQFITQTLAFINKNINNPHI